MSAAPASPSFFAKLFRTKGVDGILKQQADQEHKLERSLSAFDLVIFGVGAMVGAGIFVLTGTAAADAGGPATMISFVIAGIVCAFCALCYSEFAAMVPVSGSAYTYAFSTMGELIAWIIGWALVLEYAVGNMAVAVGWTGSINELLHQVFNYQLPAWLVSNTIDTVPAAKPLAHPELLISSFPFMLPGAQEEQLLLVQKAFNIPAFLIVVLITGLLIRGTSENAKQAAVMVFVKTSVILLFIGAGLFFFTQGANLQLLQTNWFAEGWNTFSPNGWDGIFLAASTVFFAYIGFDAVACAAEETKNPQKDIPIGIIGSLAICTVLYILVTGIITAVVPLELINKEAAVVHAMGQMGFPGAGLIVSLGTIFGLTSVLLVLQMAGIRIFYTIARDGLLPDALTKLHPKFSTPHITTVLVGIFVALGSGLLPITLLAHMCNIGTLGAFLVVCLGVLLLRLTDPNRKRPFKAPFGLTVPILGILGCVFVMSKLPAETWAITIVWFILGILLYFGYGFKNSVLARQQEQEAADQVDSEQPSPQLHTA